MTDIGNTIRQLRKERGMTQQELAAQAKISGTTLWQVETGRTTPRLPVVQKLARVLDVEPEEIMFPKGGALKFQPEVDEGQYEDFMYYVRALDIGGLTRLMATLREDQRKAVAAGDMQRAADLYNRAVLVSQQIDELDPPTASIKLRPGLPAEVTFFKDPTDEELRDLQEKYPGYVTTSSPVVT